jgi:HEAT repeat protein
MRAVIFALAIGALAAEQPRIINGQVVPETAGTGFDAAFHRLVAAQTEPAWIGYSVPTARDGNRRLCCNGDTWVSDGVVITNGRIATCGLEPGDRSMRTAQGQPLANQGPIRLEGPDTMVVLYRVEDKAVRRIRIFSPDCELDAGGRTIHWFDAVSGADSIALLSTFVTAGIDQLRGGALAAVAMHTDDRSVPALLKFAKQDANAKVRGDALFWVAQKAGERAAGEITSAIENDPDTDVKRRAVFALSQLPRDEGVPLLIKVARTNQNPAVRKQAMFWLGQSKDPRALAFFAEVLGK